MKTVKKREVGVGNNLYGIPIDDIMSPHELDKIRSDIKKAPKVKKEKKPKAKKTLPKIKIPKITLTPNATRIAIITLAAFVLLLIFKGAIFTYIFPKLSVSDALDNTFKELKEETAQFSDTLFGFDVGNKNESSINFETSVYKDTADAVDGFSLNGNMGFSKKDNNMMALLQCFDNDGYITSVASYLNNNELGFSLPEIMGEYCVAPTNSFGKEWNRSGLRKVVYASETDENSDISFSNIFDDEGLLTKKGIKQLSKTKDKFISESSCKYGGKEKISINGKEKKAKSFLMNVAGEESEKFFVSSINTVLEDESVKKKLAFFGKNSGTFEKLSNIAMRLEESIDLKECSLKVFMYDDKVVRVDFSVPFTENNSVSVLSGTIFIKDSKTLLNNIEFSYEISGATNYAFDFVTKGNHLEGKMFSNETVIRQMSDLINKTLKSNITLDFKDGVAKGEVSSFHGENQTLLQYGGTCSKKSGLDLELSDVKIKTTGAKSREISGKIQLEIVPKINMGKINAAGKRNILELDKTAVEDYLSKLQENESMKRFLNFTDSIFKGTVNE